jgi:hypothetical protein
MIRLDGTQTAPSYGALIKPRRNVVANLPQEFFCIGRRAKSKNLLVKSSQWTLKRRNADHPMAVIIAALFAPFHYFDRSNPLAAAAIACDSMRCRRAALFSPVFSSGGYRSLPVQDCQLIVASKLQ